MKLVNIMDSNFKLARNNLIIGIFKKIKTKLDLVSFR